MVEGDHPRPADVTWPSWRMPPAQCVLDPSMVGGQGGTRPATRRDARPSWQVRPALAAFELSRNSRRRRLRIRSRRPRLRRCDEAVPRQLRLRRVPDRRADSGIVEQQPAQIAQPPAA